MGAKKLKLATIFGGGLKTETDNFGGLKLKLAILKLATIFMGGLNTEAGNFGGLKTENWQFWGV